MFIVSLFKIWQGNDFLVESIESNYWHVDAMVFVSSNMSWTGEEGNDTKEVVLKWKAENDFYDKIKVIEYDTRSQWEQYQIGINYIKAVFPQCDWMQIVDADEVWNECAWNNSIDHLYNARNYNSFRCNMRTFIKSPEFEIIEGAGCVKPFVFVKGGTNYEGCRFSSFGSKIIMQDVCIDHYSLVKKSFEEMKRKFLACSMSEYGKDNLVDMEKWKANVWDKIPDGECYHFYKGCERIWKGFKRTDG